ncbi:hypothetical protein [Cohaesibacter sp. ES.047]|uniref:hypothetical protein n=1 Tax=Cohaesibacter sp. ES.047 TaxID=1798205 RepID=UPI0012FE1C6C|nr:hypothetical protein [Cohaesibacter sp. ES.047]
MRHTRPEHQIRFHSVRMFVAPADYAIGFFYFFFGKPAGLELAICFSNVLVSAVLAVLSFLGLRASLLLRCCFLDMELNLTVGDGLKRPISHFRCRETQGAFDTALKFLYLFIFEFLNSTRSDGASAQATSIKF